jgi:glutamate 5-kinase
MPARARKSAQPLQQAKRVVVKIGSALLVEQATGRLNRAWLETLAADVARLRGRGQEVIVVSSGAIALGRRHLGLPTGRLKLEESQAAAAVGQIRLAHAWKEVLDAHELTVAQILLTFGDTEERRRYLNARSTLGALLKLGSIPLINENDTVATSEIRYGDNDRLAARVAQMMGADCLVLLSDVDGLYTADPTRDPAAVFIPEVHGITPDIERMAGGSSSAVGSGGMATKIAAARIAVAAGCHMCVALGREMHPLKRLESGVRCSWFFPAATPSTVRKQWIAGTLKPAGELRVDAGAVAALRRGKSLLPAGVIRVSGKFDRGDALLVVDGEGLELARGLSAYSSDDAERIIGRKSGEIEAILGYRGRDEMIHRDDLVVTGLDGEQSRPS